MTHPKLHVRQLRPGRGTPVVLLHGFMGCGADFEALVKTQEFPPRRVLAVDLPAHGESEDFPADYGFGETVDAILDAVELEEPFDLVGYSMGGRIALHLCGTNPNRVRSLALIGAHPGIEHPGDRQKRLAVDEQRAGLLVEHPAEFVAEWGELDLFGDRTPSAWGAVKERRAEQARSHAYGWSRAMLTLSVGKQVMLWNIPYGTEKPTLYVVGGMDERYLAIGREMVAQNPGHVELSVIGGAHHSAHLDRPGVVARRLRDFWSAIP